MAKLEFVVEITAPPDRVAVFFVPQRMPYWYGAEMRCEFEVEGGAADFRTGLKVHIAGRLGRRAVSLTAVITRFNWGRLLEWRFQDAYGIRGLQRWEIEPGVLGARVRMCDEYELPGPPGGISDRLVTRHAVRRRDLRDLARLKRIAEQA